jgi:hypothetical protein
MSEHTLCNRCTLDGLRRAAKRRQSDRGPNPTHWLRHVPERCAC